MSSETTPNETSRNRAREFRRVVANVVGELRSQESRNSFAAVTLLELAARHADRLDTGDPMRPSRKHRLKTVYDQYKASIAAIKETPVEMFRSHDPATDANTEP